jgi:uncharacterized protein YndB with AHSA1/START domain
MPNDTSTRPVADDELYIERVFEAPVQLVFDMWAKAEHLLRWLGPADSRGVAADLDFRVGGAWSAHIVMQQYGDARMGGRYLEIEPGRRIVKTFQWRNGEGDPETVITLGFYDLGDGRTRQTFHQAPFATVPRRDSHIDGWTQSFNSEQAYVEATAREIAR